MQKYPTDYFNNTIVPNCIEAFKNGYASECKGNCNSNGFISIGIRYINGYKIFMCCNVEKQQVKYHVGKTNLKGDTSVGVCNENDCYCDNYHIYLDEPRITIKKKNVRKVPVNVTRSWSTNTNTNTKTKTKTDWASIGSSYKALTDELADVLLQENTFDEEHAELIGRINKCKDELYDLTLKYDSLKIESMSSIKSSEMIKKELETLVIDANISDDMVEFLKGVSS